MTKEQLEVYRKSLTDLAATVERVLAHAQREFMHMDEPDLPGGPLASSDEVMDSGTQEATTGVMVAEERLLAEVKAALGRIEAGTFGRCEWCDHPVPHPRLDAVPYARRCVRCAKEAEAAP